MGTQDKLLIKFGWDAPTTDEFVTNAAAMDTQPFDGSEIRVMSALQPTKSMAMYVFASGAFTLSEYSHAFGDLASVTNLARLKNNFVLASTYARTSCYSWMDDAWSVVTGNIGVLAEIAKQGGSGHCVGIFLDPEDYDGKKIWCYEEMPASWTSGTTFVDMAAKVRVRGQEFIGAINAKYPNVTILSLFGPSINAYEPGVSPSGQQYGLFREFWDGMCEAADAGTTIVDGFEGAYGNTTEANFIANKNRYLTGSTSLNQVEYDAHTRFGLPVWLDNSGDWDNNNYDNNTYTPSEFENIVKLAMQYSDKYVWIYSCYVGWWPNASDTRIVYDVPSEYVTALANAAGSRFTPPKLGDPKGFPNTVRVRFRIPPDSDPIEKRNVP